MKFLILLTLLHDIKKVIFFKPHDYGIVKRQLYVAICKPRHWNLGIGIGIRIGTGTDIISAIIFTSIRPIAFKLSRAVTQMNGTHQQSHVVT